MVVPGSLFNGKIDPKLAWKLDALMGISQLVKMR